MPRPRSRTTSATSREFAQFFKRSPDRLSHTHLRYQAYLLRERRLAPPPEHVPHGEYQLIPPSFVDLRAGGSTNRSDDFPIGVRSNDVAIWRQEHVPSTRRMS